MLTRKVICFCTPLNTERIGGILRYAHEHDWHINLAGTGDERFLAWGADGVLATIRDNAAGRRIHRLFTTSGTPIVDLTNERPDLDLPRVVCDHEAIGRIAARHLRERGFENFAWFSTDWSNIHALRYQGFCSGGTVDKWIVHTAPVWCGDWEKFLAWLKPLLIAKAKPLGVLAYDESDASRILSACRELGIVVPGQVAVISCGNESLLCDNQPITISGIDANLDKQGYEAARALDNLMKGKSRTVAHRLIPPMGIVLRQSTDVYTSSDPTVRAAFKFIADNLHRPIGAAEIAKALTVPRHRIDRLFAATLRTSAGHVIAHQRLDRARCLLEEMDKTVAAIARECGYCNAGYLVNLFRRTYGNTPAAYRKGWRNAQCPRS